MIQPVNYGQALERIERYEAEILRLSECLMEHCPELIGPDGGAIQTAIHAIEAFASGYRPERDDRQPRVVASGVVRVAD